MFEVTKRNGLARIGKWLVEEQNAEVMTPNVLFISADGIRPPDEAEVLISKEKLSGKKPYLTASETLFSDSKDEIPDYSFSPHLVYPPSQMELNAYAAKLNKEKLSSKVFVVTGKEDAIADAVEGVDAEVYVLANAMHLIRNPKVFVNTLVNLRKVVGYQNLIYTPGLGNPHHIALLIHCGVDLLDSVPLILNARLGNFLTAQGKVNIDEIGEEFCYCPACLDGKTDYETILCHNYLASLSELKTVRNAIRNERLRELVESRIRSEPWMVSVLRILDSRYYSFQERHFPVTGGLLIAASGESLYRPDIVRFRKRVKERYKRPPNKKILLFLPCSAKKPYSFSKTHKAFKRIIDEAGNKTVVHEVVITSPLGVVPREVELFYPAQNYDIPVTRTWSKDEISMIGDGITSYLEINKYAAIVAHLPEDCMFIKDYIDGFEHTCPNSPTSSTSLERLREILTELVKPYEKTDRQTDMRESMMSFARFQFGNAGESLVQDAVIKGRYPNLRIFRNGIQVGMLVGERGLISLTLEGGKVLASQKAYWVKISDFKPKGNIFAVGVEDADENIRIGDDVVVLRDDELVGVGVAVMNPEEMVESDRGEAVRIRHLVKSDVRA